MTDELWERFYQTKIEQHAQGGICIGCGRKASDSDHLFVTRGMGGHDRTELQEPWNIAPLCNSCNVQRRYDTMVKAALIKLRQYGPSYLEPRIFKYGHGLPAHYLDALKEYNKEIK